MLDAALSELDLEVEHIINIYDERIREIRREYHKELEKIQLRRGQVLTDEDYMSNSPSERRDVELLNLPNRANLVVHAPGTPNWPGFWLNALKNCSLISSYIYECDEPILSYLSNITSPEETEIVFHFADNPYFSNKKLSLDFEYREFPNIDWLQDCDYSFFNIFFESEDDVTNAVIAIRDCLLIKPLDHALNNHECIGSQSTNPGSRYPFSMFA